jgi:hypothetical protein
VSPPDASKEVARLTEEEAPSKPELHSFQLEVVESSVSDDEVRELLEKVEELESGEIKVSPALKVLRANSS